MVGQGIRPDRLHEQLAYRLLDLGALDLQDRGLGIGAVAVVPLGRDHAKLRHLQRLELHLERGNLHAEAIILDQRLVAEPLERRDFLEPAQPRLRDADPGDPGALVAEQELGVIPALVLRADAVLNAHVVEKHLVHFFAARWS